MAIIKIHVSGPHPIFDGDGKSMSPGFEYSVKDTPLIQNYASEGRVLILEPEKDSSDKTDKKLNTKTLTDQTAGSDKTFEENSNG
jgi:hypothetical protein